MFYYHWVQQVHIFYKNIVPMHMNKKYQGKSNAFSHCAYFMFNKMKMKFTIHNMMSFTRFNDLFH